MIHAYLTMMDLNNVRIQKTIQTGKDPGEINPGGGGGTPSGPPPELQALLDGLLAGGGDEDDDGGTIDSI